MTRPVRVHIDRLVLHGFDPRERVRVGESIRREIARAIAARGVEPRAGIRATIADAVRGAVRR